MADIDELETRISAAFARIGAGTEAIVSRAEAIAGAPPPEPPQPGIDPDEFAALQSQLEDERLANAQLEERVRALRTRQEAQVASLESRLEEEREAMARLDSELQRLRQAVELLREANEGLRRANESQVGEPHLINRSMLAELESLRAERAAEKAEVGGLLSVLEPLLAEAQDTTEEETA